MPDSPFFSKVAVFGEFHLTVYNTQTKRVEKLSRQCILNGSIAMLRPLLQPVPRLIPGTQGISLAVHELGPERRRIELIRGKVLVSAVLDWSRGPVPDSLPKGVTSPWLVLFPAPDLMQQNQDVIPMLSPLVVAIAWAVLEEHVSRN
ncbi:MAG: hypothetical protein ACO1QS_11575 [Verrucomicrobiota bacterium]